MKKAVRAGTVASRTDGFYQNLSKDSSERPKKDKDNHAADVKAAETPSPPPQKGVENPPASTTAGNSSPLTPESSTYISSRTSSAVLIRWKFAPNSPKINPAFAILNHLTDAKFTVVRVNKAKGGLEVFFRNEKTTLEVLNFIQQKSSICNDSMNLSAKYLYPGIRTEIRTLDTCTSAGFLLTEEMLSQALSKLLGETCLSIRPDYLFIKDTSILSGFSVYTRRELRKEWGDPDTFEVVGPNNTHLVCQLILRKRKDNNKPTSSLRSSNPFFASTGGPTVTETVEAVKARKIEKNKKKREAKKEKNKKNLVEASRVASTSSSSQFVSINGDLPTPSNLSDAKDIKSSAKDINKS
jgi:hypothetical protein